MLLHLHIHRNENNIELGIYRKPAQSDTTIHFTSNNPLKQKLSAYIFYVNRLLFTPITDQPRQQEWNTIRIIAKNNVFPLQLLHNLKNRLLQHNRQPTSPHKQKRKNG